MVEKSEEMVSGIAVSSNYQATAIAQIDQAIEQVSQVVQTNSATSEECAAAAQEMAEQSGLVRELLSVYTLNDAEAMQGTKVGGYAGYSKAGRNEEIISLKGNFGKY